MRVRVKGFGHVYLHVDSDVLSLDDYPQAVVAVPGGVSTAALVSFLQTVRANFPAGAALTEFSRRRRHRRHRNARLPPAG